MKNRQVNFVNLDKIKVTKKIIQLFSNNLTIFCPDYAYIYVAHQNNLKRFQKDPTNSNKWK